MTKVSFRSLGKFGALGNQLWQIASTFGISVSGNTEPLFPSDWFYKPYFSIPHNFFEESLEGSTDLGEEYFQDLRYFTSVSSSVLNMFKPSEQIKDILDDIYGNSLNSFTAVHVRRGNNVEPQYASHHPVCDIDYYEKAMSMTGGPYIIFTDSPDWCKQQSVFDGCEYGYGPPSNIDVMLLTNAEPLGTIEAAIDIHAIARCSNVIMSNSTFSWWGSWMHGPRIDGQKVIYPSRWFGEPLSHIDTSVMFNSTWAKEWIKL